MRNDELTRTDGGIGRETIDNPQRGCNYLRQDTGYIRSEYSASGTLPPFVLFCQPGVSPSELLDARSSVPDAEAQSKFSGIDEDLLKPLPYKEDIGRGYNYAAGTDVCLALEPDREMVPAYRNYEGALASLVQMGEYDSIEEVPRNETERHIDRMRSETVSQSHWGQIDAMRSKDLLMRAGKTYYPTPKEYVDECLAYGLNKGINVNARQSPPAVNPGRTRCFIVHPHACGEDLAGVIGFAYLTRVVYTEDSDGEVPNYVEDYESGDHLDVVRPGEREPAETPEPESGEDENTSSEEATETADGSEAGEPVETDGGSDRSTQSRLGSATKETNR